LRRAVFASQRLNRVLVHADSAAAIPELAALSQGRAARDGKAMAYVCEKFTCKAPIEDSAALREALDAR
jgi:uncharacterized protein YyaL (SSP411 family)